MVEVSIAPQKASKLGRKSILSLPCFVGLLVRLFSQLLAGWSSEASASDSHQTCWRLNFFAKGPGSLVVELLVSVPEHLSTVSADEAEDLASAPGHPLKGLCVSVYS